MSVTLSPHNLLDHPAFRGLERQNFQTPAKYQRNGIGQLISVDFDRTWTLQEAWLTDRIENTILPWGWLHEEIYEWICLAEAVRAAKTSFTMVELGAGYGRWITAGAVLARKLRPDLSIKLVGVEAEPTHFQWLCQHLRDNDLNPDDHDLINAAVAAEFGTVQFVDHADPGMDYGQYVWDGGWVDPTRLAPRAARAIGINEILRKYDLIDLIDMDVQGYERIIVPAAIEEMNRRVRRIYIGIHEPAAIATELTEIFKGNGWSNLASFPFKSEVITEYGQISFTDGCQYWMNPRL